MEKLSKNNLIANRVISMIIGILMGVALVIVGAIVDVGTLIWLAMVVWGIIVIIGNIPGVVYSIANIKNKGAIFDLIMSVIGILLGVGLIVSHNEVISIILAAYMIILVLSTIVVSLDGLSMTTNITAVLACFNNIGPGLEIVGPTGNFSSFSVFSKLILSIDMLAGRLEIFPILALLSRRTWNRK